MKSILTFLLIILMDIQFNYACPCSPTNTFIEMNESFASQFQTATIIPMFLWQSSWSYPIEGLAIGLLISLIVYYRMVYSTKLFPHEKLRLILNITHKTQTPLTLIHHLLEEIISDSLSESTSQKIKRILGYTVILWVATRTLRYSTIRRMNCIRAPLPLNSNFTLL